MFFVRKLPTRPRLQLVLEVGNRFIAWQLEERPSRNPADSTTAELLEDIEPPTRDQLLTEDDHGLVWDFGTYEDKGDIEKDMWRGKLSLVLFGLKLRGTWVLGRNKGRWVGRGKPWVPAKNWTLVKYPDESATTEKPRIYGSASVLSGRDVEDFSGSERREQIQAIAEEAGAKRARVALSSFEPMEAGSTAAPFTDADYLFEIHPGGVPVTAALQRGKGWLQTLESDEVSACFPELGVALASLGVPHLIAQGEIVSTRPLEPITLADAMVQPATLHLYDLLACDGWDLRAVPLGSRKAALGALVEHGTLIRYCDHLEEQGETVWRQTAAQLPEGAHIVARAIGGTYEPGPHEDWIELEGEDEAHADDEGATIVEGAVTRRPVRLSNQDKVFWPEAGYTKGELLHYYEHIATFMLPFLEDRAVVLKRFVDGIDGRAFFQHNAPGAKSSWLRTVRIRTSRRPRDYFLIDDVESLLYLVNLATIPFHLWHSRVGNLDRPDWCVVDVDRSESSFENVVRVTLAARKFCDGAGLPNYVKTSGGTGLHVLIPLGGELTYDQSRLLAELVARAVQEEHPGLASTEGLIEKRGGRVYLDALVNARGRMIVSPFSVRAKPGAPVSMPLSWDQVNDQLDPATFNIKTALDHAPRAASAWSGFWEDRVDLRAMLEQIASR